MAEPTGRRLTFRNFGGIYQLQVQDADDLAGIQTLDRARWAATSAPVNDLRCDPAFLAHMDPAKQGRIRTSDLLSARDWLFERLSGRSSLHEKSEVVRLADLDVRNPAGALIRQAAEHVLKHLGVDDRKTIALAQVRAFRAAYTKTLANGDGVVPPEFVTDPELAQLAKDVMALGGSTPDLSGLPGIGTAQIDKFLERCDAWREWQALPQAHESGILVFGEATSTTAALVEALDSKITQYFWQCDLLQQEAQAESRLRLSEEELKQLRISDPAAIEKVLSDAPLARPRPSGVLPLDAEVNPAYRERLLALRQTVLAPAFGGEPHELTRPAWEKVKALFAEYRAWRGKKPSEPFEDVPEARLASYSDGQLVERLRTLVAEDKDSADEIGQVENLEKLVLYQRWLVELVNNFVNFSALYHPALRSLFEFGSLVIDGRRLEFCVRVGDRAAHKKIASESGMFLVYAQVTDKAGTAAFEVAAPVTAGEKGRLRVGKRGVFFGLDGKEYDVEVLELVENAISIAEAIKQPFRRLKDFIAKKVEDLASSQLATAEKSAQEKTVEAGTAPAPAPVKAAPPAGGGMAGMSSLLMGGGIALAAVSSALAFIVSSLSKVNPLGALSALASVIGVVIVLAGFLGWLKLRRRDMALLIEANGWALNANMKLTGRLGRFFTRIPGIPKGSKIERLDALAPLAGEMGEQRTGSGRWLLRLLLLALILAGLAFLAHQQGYWSLEQVQAWFKLAAEAPAAPPA